MAKPITAARETTPRGGLAAALGLGVIVPDDDPLDPNNEWLGPLGYQLEGPACNPTWRAGATACGPDFEPPEGVRRLQVGPVSYPFVVGATVDCSTFSGDNDLGRYQEDARRALELCQWSEIANELWTGATALEHGWSNKRLASPDAVV